MNKMLLHGTSTANTKSIIENGCLSPRIKKDGNFWLSGSNQNYVYLTDRMILAEWYGYRSAIVSGVNSYSILSVEREDLSESKLYPDEAYIANLHNKPIYTEEDVKIFKRLMKSSSHLHEKSLTKNGAIAHKGKIKLNSFHFKDFDVKETVWYNKNFHVHSTKQNATNHQWFIHYSNTNNQIGWNDYCRMNSLKEFSIKEFKFKIMEKILIYLEV